MELQRLSVTAILEGREVLVGATGVSCYLQDPESIDLFSDQSFEPHTKIGRLS